LSRKPGCFNAIEIEHRARARAWRRRLVALDHAAAAEIRQLRLTGLSFDEALDALLATVEGAGMLDEYKWISDALDVEDRTTEHAGSGWSH
jgi:hypothetical protein